ncbi:hypothetical protein PO124_22485 [Bacillus licheniformis]|nr:hypothetical protein [Bacillus licheniformis]
MALFKIIMWKGVYKSLIVTLKNSQLNSSSLYCFEAPLSAKHVNLMIDELTGTLPVSDLESGDITLKKEQIEEDESDRWAAIASGEEELY